MLHYFTGLERATRYLKQPRILKPKMGGVVNKKRRPDFSVEESIKKKTAGIGYPALQCALLRESTHSHTLPG